MMKKPPCQISMRSRQPAVIVIFCCCLIASLTGCQHDIRETQEFSESVAYSDHTTELDSPGLDRIERALEDLHLAMGVLEERFTQNTDATTAAGGTVADGIDSLHATAADISSQLASIREQLPTGPLQVDVHANLESATSMLEIVNGQLAALVVATQRTASGISELSNAVSRPGGATTSREESPELLAVGNELRRLNGLLAPVVSCVCDLQSSLSDRQPTAAPLPPSCSLAQVIAACLAILVGLLVFVIGRSKQAPLPTASGASILLFGLIVWLQCEGPSVLSIPPAWLGVALLPLVVGLVAGGHLTEFSGFGVQLKATKTKTAEDLNLLKGDEVAFSTSDAVRKGGTRELSALSKNLPTAIRAQMRLLVFFTNLGHYEERAIRQYLDLFPFIQYFVVLGCDRHSMYLDDDDFVDLDVSRSRFLYFMPRSMDSSTIERFVEHLNSGSTAPFRGSIQLAASIDTPVSKLWNRLEDSRAEAIALTTSTGVFAGIVSKHEIEAAIGRQLLAKSSRRDSW